MRFNSRPALLLIVNKEKFVAVKIDGETVDSENYTVEEDGTVTLNASFLETLTLGEHSLTIVSNDGEATARFTVNAANHEGGTSPNTGDSTNLYLWTALMAISLCGIATVVFFGRKRKIV